MNLAEAAARGITKLTRAEWPPTQYLQVTIKPSPKTPGVQTDDTYEPVGYAVLLGEDLKTILARATVVILFGPEDGYEEWKKP